MINSTNISAWFKDCAARHPLFLHSESNKRFFEPAPGRQWGVGVTVGYAF